MSRDDLARKYSIFISSSFKDLKEARHQLLVEILKIGHIPIGMEMFHAGDALNLTVIEKAIRECDIFVILVGARMGESIGIGDEKKRCFVEWEYELARGIGMPIIVFLLDETEYQKEREKLPLSDIERQNDITLAEFRKEVQQASEGYGKRIVEFFSYNDIGDLRAKLSNAIKLEFPLLSGGWVSGNQYDKLVKRVQFDEAVSSNPFFARYAKRLNLFEKLSKRTLLQKDLKSAIARYFWKLYLPKIALNNITRLFFESGSSIAYLSEEFMISVDKARWGRDLCKKLRIATNNILTFLDFALIEPTSDLYNVVLEPKGPFEPYYGATFGELAEAVELPCPTKPEPLNPNALPHVKTIINNLNEFFDEQGLILMTASGIELNNESPFFGPHVGSYYNKLVKRCLLEVKMPTVIFLDQDKFPYPFNIGKCYPVCGSDFSWGLVIKEHPLALALACNNKENYNVMMKGLMDMGFINEQPEVEENGVWPIIAVNKQFIEKFESP